MATSKHLLLVDDDTTLSEMYAERLKKAGYQVTLAHDGEAGLAASKTHPDLILLDIMMPKMNGLDTLKAIKADPATADIPVVLLTALIQEMEKHKGVTEGAAGYLVKSEIMPGELIEKIEEIMAAKPTQATPSQANEAAGQPVSPQSPTPPQSASPESPSTQG